MSFSARGCVCVWIWKSLPTSAFLWEVQLFWQVMGTHTWTCMHAQMEACVVAAGVTSPQDGGAGREEINVRCPALTNYQSIYSSIYLSVHLAIYPCLSVCLAIYLSPIPFICVAPCVCLTPRSQCQHLISTICKWTGAGPEGQSTNWRQNNSTMVHLFVCQRERERVCVCPNACLELCDCLCVVTWLWVSAMCPYPNSGAICGSAYTSQLLNNHDLINPVMKGWRKQNQSKNTPPPQKKKCLLFCKFSQNKVFCQICTLCRFWYKQQHASWLKTAVSLHQAWNGKPYLEVMKADGSGGKLNQSLD